MKKILLIFSILFCFGFTYKDFYVAHLAEVRKDAESWCIYCPKMSRLSEYLINKENPTVEDREEILSAFDDKLIYLSLLPADGFRDAIACPFTSMLFYSNEDLISIRYLSDRRILVYIRNGIREEVEEFSGYDIPDYDEINFLMGRYSLIRREDNFFIVNEQGEELQLQ